MIEDIVVNTPEKIADLLVQNPNFIVTRTACKYDEGSSTSKVHVFVIHKNYWYETENKQSKG